MFEENVFADLVGTIYDEKDDDFGTAKVYFKGEKIVDFNLEPILNPHIRKKYILEEMPSTSDSCNNDSNNCNVNNNPNPNTVFNINISYYDIANLGKLVLEDLDVCSKRFLTSKVDRSVTGLVARQQCVGPLGVPCANYSANLFSYTDNVAVHLLENVRFLDYFLKSFRHNTHWLKC